jgi:hypothetical protein
LEARSTVTPKALQKIVWAGANNGSYALAASALGRLAEISLAPKQVRRLVGVIGRARLDERDKAVEQLRTMALPARRAGNPAVRAPAVAVISMDGGRYQRRDNFQSESTASSVDTHWRETKVGCLLSMQSDELQHDPAPQFPAWLATSAAVAELAKIAEKTADSAGHAKNDRAASCENATLDYEPPELISRDVLASSDDAETFGWQLESRAWQLGFPAAQRQAFLADGLTVNWTIARRHFPRATPILDLMHALSYAWSAAVASGEGATYRMWAEWIWQGKVGQVITALQELQNRLGDPPAGADASDPRQRVARARTYYSKNQSRMNYPTYRRLGLPLTSSHIESTVKQINQRIKGTEKFWNRQGGDAVLQLRADALSDSDPLTPFWQRWHSSQTGANCYHTAA